MLSEQTPQVERIWGINWKTLPIINKSSPTISGRFGIKYTDPTVNNILPISEQNALNDPKFYKGLNMLKYGSRYVPAKSVTMSNIDPIVNNIPPVAGLMWLAKEGQ